MSDAPIDLGAIAAELAQASGKMTRLLGESVGEGRSDTAWRVLGSLERVKSQRVGELAAEQRVAQPTMTGLVIRLEKDRMVKRHGDPKDRRVALVNLTKRGQKAVGRYRERATNLLLDGIEAFSEEDQAVLARALVLMQRLNAEMADDLDD
ncbi:MarR family winged helix-turn-helix transcriptional regulator [Glutamicibacter sp. JC586]|uniref:MarR family winged helix-turn-helix transcriptional regulator n=1 Tax=Glutamicibacter sp. JC586 TaxID=2590552 RepID=UPI0013593308|nr:MarR family transcriptional regulator [Glutamicibacter sp. JC586]